MLLLSRKRHDSKGMAMGTTFGYARVSTQEQNLNRQLDALREFGVTDRCVFTDKTSGRDFNRPSYRRLMRRLCQGDVLVITSIDRLGRNYQEIIREWRCLTLEKGVQMVVLDMPLLDTRHERDGITGVLIADIVLQLLSYVAHVEREHIHERQAEGIAAAQARGVRFGRPKIERPETYEAVRDAYREREITRAEAARQLGVCASTFDRWLKADAEG